MNKISTKKLVLLAVFIALEIISSRFLSIEFADRKYGFTFIISAVKGALFGPWLSALAGIVTDILGNSLFGKYAFFPGFTLTAAVSGLIYGYCLYGKKISFKNILLVIVLITLIPNMGLNTLWVSMMQGIPFKAAFITRIPAQIINLSIKIVLLPILLPKLVEVGRKEFKRLGVE